ASASVLANEVRQQNAHSLNNPIIAKAQPSPRNRQYQQTLRPPIIAPHAATACLTSGSIRPTNLHSYF
ncbi:hypothetical protein, partial [Pseudomonas sp. Larv2_ips]|uniref:hypothetical protein n=1 Tax=Pseudomonas sp. Larv2_ips TaxID=1896942 RepID=UPI001C49802D